MASAQGGPCLLGVTRPPLRAAPFFFLLKCMEKASERDFARKVRWIQFWVTIKSLYIQFFGFPFIFWGIFFIKQHFVLLDLEAQGITVDGRNDIVYWISMALALWMFYETMKELVLIGFGNCERFEHLLPEDPDKEDKVAQLVKRRDEKAL